MAGGSVNFAFLGGHDPALVGYAAEAEAVFGRHPRLCVSKAQPIFSKAFRGELVPQDPNDEPAHVLLARIKGQGGEVVKRGRGRPRKGAV